MVVSFAVVYFYYMMNTYNHVFSLKPGIIIKFIMIILFLLLPEKERRNIFELYTRLFALSLIPAICFSVLSIIGFDVPYDVIASSQEIKVNQNFEYIHYPGSVFCENRYSISRFKRLCGIYDEHGMAGTVAGLLLAGNQFKLKKHKELVIILVGGILSVSLAFFVIVGLYYVYVLLKNRKKKRLITLISLILICAGVLFLLRNNEVVNRLVISRLRITYLMSNKRADSTFIALFSDFLRSDNILWGYGNNNPIFNTVDAASYKVLIYDIGFVGFFIYVLWFLYWGVRNAGKNIEALILLVLFMLSFLQRPWILYLYFMIILFGGIDKIRQEYCSDIARKSEG